MDRPTIKNEVRYFEGDPPELDDILGGPDDLENASELAGAIGSPLPGESPRVPAASVAAIMVLDAVGSPFLSGTEVGLQDIVIAMYVLANPRNAAACITGHVARRQAERAYSESARTPEHLDAYLKHLDAKDRLLDVATGWIDGIEGFNPADVVEDIGSSLKLAMSGWSMIPLKGEKKKEV